MGQRSKIIFVNASLTNRRINVSFSFYLGTIQKSPKLSRSVKW